MIQPRQTLVLSLAVAATLTLGACGNSKTPTSTPVVTVAPGPTPTPAQPSATCSLGKGSVAAVCGAGEGALLPAIDAAIEQLTVTHPEYFVLGETRGPGEFRVRNKDSVIEGLLAILTGQHMCANRIPLSDQIELKDSNAYSEVYLIVTDRGYLARGKESEVKTCTPAAFPLDVGESVVRIFVGIYRFRCTDDVVPPPTYANVVPVQCDALITMTPKDKDGQNVPSWLHSMNPEFWVRNGENTVMVLGDLPNEPFNKWIYPKNPGAFSICAAVDGKQTCMNANVVP